MSSIIYEQVPHNSENSFFYRRCTSWYKSAIGYHQHPELEIGFVIKGGGQRITDDFIENYHRKITLGEVADHIAMNKNAFCLFFKKSVNEPFTVYLNRFRLQMAVTLLNRTDQNISEIAYAVGFADIPYFNRCFKKEYGISPAEYRSKYKR